MSETVLASHTDKTRRDHSVYHPSIFNLKTPGEQERMDQLLQDSPFIQVSDELRSQLRELLKSRNPSLKLNQEQLDKMVDKHLGNSDPAHYGVWIYYPWSYRLLHILDESEFIEVRTNRNQYKITVEERDRLGQLRVGVIGLSVGKTISMAMAMERSFGEIRLADYDTLELTNLNRIQTGLYNLGISKAIAVAREIAEMDPYLKTVCYTDGLTEENMDDFFLKGGKLDMLVEECDGLDIKILCRQKARALRIPVVMDMNDRGTLDVERFDLEPDRPLLHGMIDHLDISKIKNLSNEEKVPYILPILGSETISSKLKASMIEIGQTLTTWPQLGSAVVLGGALAADVCRRIALDQFHESGRYFVDLEELICDKAPAQLPHVPEDTTKETELTREEMLETIRLQAILPDESQLELSEAQVVELITAAVAAPSAGNNQPWKWIYTEKKLCLFHDRIRSSDFQHIFSFLGLGATTENLILKAHELDLEVSCLNKTGDDSKLIAVFRFYKTATLPKDIHLEPHPCDSLSKGIFLRGTNRKYGIRRTIDSDRLSQLLTATKSIPGADLKFLDSNADLKEAEDIVGCVDRIRLMNEEDHQEFVHEMRWTKEDAERTQDGIDLATVELTPSELAGFRMAVTPDVIRHLNAWKGGTAFEKMGRQAVQTASALALVTMPAYSSVNFFNGGRALQRAWIQANLLGISVHPVSACTYFFSRLVHGQAKRFSPHMEQELTQLHARFNRLFALEGNTEHVFLIKLHIANEMETKALRRPLTEVLYLK
ncbi:MAG: Rv1355c family protein [Bacteroidia bacterium]